MEKSNILRKKLLRVLIAAVSGAALADGVIFLAYLCGHNGGLFGQVIGLFSYALIIPYVMLCSALNWKNAPNLYVFYGVFFAIMFAVVTLYRQFINKDSDEK
jgi:hypothetical protein